MNARWPRHAAARAIRRDAFTDEPVGCVSSPITWQVTGDVGFRIEERRESFSQAAHRRRVGRGGLRHSRLDGFARPSEMAGILGAIRAQLWSPRTFDGCT